MEILREYERSLEHFIFVFVYVIMEHGPDNDNRAKKKVEWVREGVITYW